MRTGLICYQRGYLLWCLDTLLASKRQKYSLVNARENFGQDFATFQNEKWEAFRSLSVCLLIAAYLPTTRTGISSVSLNDLALKIFFLANSVVYFLPPVSFWHYQGRKPDGNDKLDSPLHRRQQRRYAPYE